MIIYFRLVLCWEVGPILKCPLSEVSLLLAKDTVVALLLIPLQILLTTFAEVEIAFFDNTPSKTEGLNELTLSIQYGGCFDAANCTFPSGLGEAVCKSMQSQQTLGTLYFNLFMHAGSTVGSSTFTGVFRPAIGSIGRNRFANLTITAFNGQCGVETVYRREVIRGT